MSILGEAIADDGDPNLVGAGDTRCRDRRVTEHRNAEVGVVGVAKLPRWVELGLVGGGSKQGIGSFETHDHGSGNSAALYQTSDHDISLAGAGGLSGVGGSLDPRLEPEATLRFCEVNHGPDRFGECRWVFRVEIVAISIDVEFETENRGPLGADLLNLP